MINLELERTIKETLQHLKEDAGFGSAELILKGDATMEQLNSLKEKAGIETFYFIKNGEGRDVFQFNFVDCLAYGEDLLFESIEDGDRDTEEEEIEIICEMVKTIARSGIVDKFTASFEILEEKTINIIEGGK